MLWFSRHVLIISYSRIYSAAWDALRLSRVAAFFCSVCASEIQSIPLAGKAAWGKLSSKISYKLIFISYFLFAKNLIILRQRSSLWLTPSFHCFWRTTGHHSCVIRVSQVSPGLNFPFCVTMSMCWIIIFFLEGFGKRVWKFETKKIVHGFVFLIPRLLNSQTK